MHGQAMSGGQVSAVCMHVYDGTYMSYRVLSVGPAMWPWHAQPLVWNALGATGPEALPQQHVTVDSK